MQNKVIKLICTALCMFSGVLFADTQTNLWAITGAWSYHFDDTKTYNETHRAVGLEYQRDNTVLLGSYLTNGDSHGNTSYVVAGGLHTNTPDSRINLNLLIGPMRHTTYTNGRTKIRALAYLSIDFGRIGANIFLRPGEDGALGLMLKIKL